MNINHITEKGNPDLTSDIIAISINDISNATQSNQPEGGEGNDHQGNR
jgi:hypothetical protein